MPIAVSTSRGYLRTTSTIGFGASVLVSLTRSNAGDSISFRRMNRPTPTRIALARNGTRQPQARNAASLVIACTSANTPVESSRPAGTPICGHEPKKPRRPLGACSTDISTAPPHSPPTPMPCAKRSDDEQDRRHDADRGVGRQQPIRNVATPMISSDSTSIDLRPMRSP